MMKLIDSFAHTVANSIYSNKMVIGGYYKEKVGHITRSSTYQSATNPVIAAYG